MSGFQKPENKPIRPPSYRWALLVLSFLLAMVIWAAVGARGLWGR